MNLESSQQSRISISISFIVSISLRSKLKSKNETKRDKMQSRCQHLLRPRLVKSISKSKLMSAESLKSNSNDTRRLNPCGIQMVNEDLRSYLFGPKKPKNQTAIDKALDHLNKFDLLNKNTEQISDVKGLKLPELYGTNLDEHFKYIGYKQILKYTKLLNRFCQTELPKLPDKFELQAGWTK
jgi:DNA polymerase gamma 1